MKLFDEIVDALSSTETSLRTALLKTKVLMHRIGHQELAEWVNDELNGYGAQAEVPEYRKIGGTLKGAVSNGIRRYSEYALPTWHLEDRIRTYFEKRNIAQSVGALEELVASGKASFIMQHPVEMGAPISKALQGYVVESLWTEVAGAQLVSILDAVRSRLLDFVLGLQEKLGDIPEAEMKEAAKGIDAPAMFQHAVFGDNTTVVVGHRNQTTIHNEVKKNDFATLSQHLKEAGLQQEDVEQLQSAIQEDANTPEVIDYVKRSFGPAVKDWMKRMLGKAIDTSWNIEVGIAGGLLTNALQTYYFS